MGLTFDIFARASDSESVVRLLSERLTSDQRAIDLRIRNPAAYFAHSPSLAVQWPYSEQAVEPLQSASLIARQLPSLAVQ